MRNIVITAAAEIGAAALLLGLGFAPTGIVAQSTNDNTGSNATSQDNSTTTASNATGNGGNMTT